MGYKISVKITDEIRQWWSVWIKWRHLPKSTPTQASKPLTKPYMGQLSGQNFDKFEHAHCGLWNVAVMPVNTRWSEVRTVKACIKLWGGWESCWMMSTSRFSMKASAAILGWRNQQRTSRLVILSTMLTQHCFQRSLSRWWWGDKNRQKRMSWEPSSSTLA